MITTNKTTLEQADILQIFDGYIKGSDYQRLQKLESYYNNVNPLITKRHDEKTWKRDKPNWYIPTAYYSTLVDSMSGYLFSNIKYVAETHDVDINGDDIEDDNESQDELSELINKTFSDINIDVVDLQTGARSVCYNKGIELVYTTGNGTDPAQIRTVSLNPLSVITVYSDDIEPVLQTAILFNKVQYKAGELNIDYELTVISKDSMDYYQVCLASKIIQSNANKESVILVWNECPIVEYKTETLNDNSCFSQVLPYIDALDALLTGNSNEIDKLADAILKLSATLSDEQKKNLGDFRVIEGLTKEDIAEYITKQTDSSFREYVGKLLINEIHKHSHVVDFYSADQGATSDASGKALKTRLVDMNMFADRIEKSVKLGWQKRIRLFKDFFIKDKRISEDAFNTNIKVIFNRTPIVGVEDIAAQLVQPTFISDRSKIELCGLDSKEEMKRLEEQKKNSGIDITDLLPKTTTPAKPETQTQPSDNTTPETTK